MRELHQRLRTTEAQLAPLQQRIRQLEAAADSAAVELTAARDQADRWQKRAQQLMQKYESVDQQEHSRVLKELREAHLRVRAAEAAATARATETVGLQAALAAEREALAAAQRRAEEAEKENQAGAARAAELAKAKVGGAGWGGRGGEGRGARRLAAVSSAVQPRQAATCPSPPRPSLPLSPPLRLPSQTDLEAAKRQHQQLVGAIKRNFNQEGAPLAQWLQVTPAWPGLAAAVRWRPPPFSPRCSPVLLG